MKIAFHSNQLGLRGSEVALYDYAHFNEELLGNQSIIVSPRDGAHSPLAVEKFKARFEVIFYDSPSELEGIVKKHAIDVFYFIKSGRDDGLQAPGCKNVVHAVFKHYYPHGDVYAYVSRWLAEKMSGGKSPFVPHMISLPEVDGDLRSELSIPADAEVYGSYGGEDSFDVKCAVDAVLKAASDPDSKKVFLFMNTRMKISTPFQYFRLKRALASRRIIYLPGTAEAEQKVKFINTCDAMIHARVSGETFGIAIGEFAYLGKPVITYYHPRTKDQCHYEILDKAGNYYSSRRELLRLIARKPHALKLCEKYRQEFNPQSVMQRFNDVFLT